MPRTLADPLGARDLRSVAESLTRQERVQDDGLMKEATGD